MFGEIMLSFLMQIAFTVGVIFVFGWLISLCNRLFYHNCGSKSATVCYATGFIGTPVHELSHALFCIIFAHRITEIRLFRVDPDDGVLGYVRHTYNRKNFYQNLGNFFIGVAPIIVISALLFLAAYLLFPGLVEQIGAFSRQITPSDLGVFFTGLWNTFVTFFSYITAWQWWVFLVIGSLLALHMTLSAADIKGALSGLIFVVAAFLIADVVLGLVNMQLLTTLTQGVLQCASYLFCFLIFALVISVISLLVSFIVRLIVKIAHRR